MRSYAVKEKNFDQRDHSIHTDRHHVTFLGKYKTYRNMFLVKVAFLGRKRHRQHGATLNISY